MKRCSVCKEHKERDEFSRHIRRKDGLRSACKECEKKTYKKQPRDKERGKRWEAEQLDSLTDRVIKQAIWRETRGTVKGNNITQEMIEAKRKEIRDGRDRLKARINGHYEGAHSLIHLVECDVCGRWFSSRWSNSKQCSDECRYEKFKEYKRIQYKNGWEQPEPFECRECGKMVVIEYGDKNDIYCSTTCQRKAVRSAGKYKRRIRLENGYVEIVSRTKVFERDGWKCHICGKKVNKRLKHPHPMSASLDHIVPLAKGGKHERRNTALAHMIM